MPAPYPPHSPWLNSASGGVLDIQASSSSSSSASGSSLSKTSLRQLPRTVMLHDTYATAVLPVDSLREPQGSAHDSKTSTPFIAYHPDFLDILGQDPQMNVIAQTPDGSAKYHEAGVWVPAAGKVFLTSNRLEPQDAGNGLVKGHVQMYWLDPNDGHIDTLPSTSALPSANGACLACNGKDIIVCDQGYGDRQPSQLSLLDPSTYEVKPILNNYFGRPFSSLNDVVVLPPVDRNAFPTIWFTDPPYGHEQGFRPEPSLPPQVYCFEPATGMIRAAADGFVKPNGLAFDKHGKKCYVTDTGFIEGTGSMDGLRPSSIYEFDVEYPAGGLPKLVNRTLFACADSGAPDGLKLDTKGNVYGGCFDGIHVWNKNGVLIGKFLFARPEVKDGSIDGCANFCFIPGGRIVAFAEDKIYMILGLATEGALL